MSPTMEQMLEDQRRREREHDDGGCTGEGCRICADRKAREACFNSFNPAPACWFASPPTTASAPAPHVEEAQP